MASMCNNHHIFVILLVISASILQIKCREISRASMREKHEEWMSRYGREYKDIIEKEERYTIFKANVEYIDSINNAGDRPYKLSLNQFADKTNEEFKSTYMSSSRTNHFKTKSSSVTTSRHESVTDIPPSIDWRKKGAVTPIRDATCGAWTLPSVDTVEGITKIKNGTLYTLSVQEIVDCYNGGENNGCSGGLLSNAFDFIKENGVTTESNYPSKDKTGKCDKKKEAEAVAKISSYEYVLADNEAALMKAVAKQPVAVSVDASGESFQFYSSGVFTGQCGTELDHGVTIVGYGTDENGKLKYWIIKNSWGTSWGEDGYMRLQKDISQKQGLCGIAMEAIYPVV